MLTFHFSRRGKQSLWNTLMINFKVLKLTLDSYWKKHIWSHIGKNIKHLKLVVWLLDSAIHWFNHYQVVKLLYKLYEVDNFYLVDSIIQASYNWLHWIAPIHALDKSLCRKILYKFYAAGNLYPQLLYLMCCMFLAIGPCLYLCPTQ